MGHTVHQPFFQWMIFSLPLSSIRMTWDRQCGSLPGKLIKMPSKRYLRCRVMSASPNPSVECQISIAGKDVFRK